MMQMLTLKAFSSHHKIELVYKFNYCEYFYLISATCTEGGLW
jgi:hypothetical protein